MKIFTLTALSFLILLSTAAAQTQTTGIPQLPQNSDVKAVDATKSTAPTDLPADYKLTPGDKLAVDVYKDPQLSKQLQVRPDGKITLPLLGDIPAAGRTSLELRDAISDALKEYITNPTVTVAVVETTPQVVYVMGEVNHPGTIPLMNGHLSILQALAMAGGFSEFANRKDVRIMRKGASGMDTLKFNYKDAVKNSTEPLQLLAGDTVIVK
jgi:polysaccharide biosynthesis/export protein